MCICCQQFSIQKKKNLISNKSDSNDILVPVNLFEHHFVHFIHILRYMRVVVKMIWCTKGFTKLLYAVHKHIWTNITLSAYYYFFFFPRSYCQKYVPMLVAREFRIVSYLVLLFSTFLFYENIFWLNRIILRNPNGVRLLLYSSQRMCLCNSENVALKCDFIFISFDISTFYYYYDFIAISFRFVDSERESLRCSQFFFLSLQCRKCKHTSQCIG